jgi:DNA-binding NtrC family response regulator
LKQLSADDRVPEDATEDLNDRLDFLVRHLVSRGVTLPQARRIFERQFILASLRLNQGNLNRSANNLGIHRNTLRTKVDALRIQSAEYRTSSKRIQSK